jgi:hypothetical protein
MHADRTNGSVEGPILFGPLRLLPAQRLLLQGDKATFDSLVAPVERPGELVGKRKLMARVWPKISGKSYGSYCAIAPRTRVSATSSIFQVEGTA